MLSNDAQDIFGTSQPKKQQFLLSNMKLTNVDKKKKIAQQDQPKRPVGVHRELYNLYVHQGKDNNKEKIESLVPTTTKKGFTLGREKLGKRAVRKWVWRHFVNEARTDDIGLEHWEREDRNPEPYQFAKFNKKLDMPTFSNAEYEEYLQDPIWSRGETSHLLELCQQFDLRWPIIEDRFDKQKFESKKSMEEMKKRYYDIINTVNEIRDLHVERLEFDAGNETRRKEQLNKLWNRTEEQIKEEEELIESVKRIEMKRKERERKANDLQKLINQAERVSLSPASMFSSGRIYRRSLKKIGTPSFLNQLNTFSPHIRWPEFKVPGPHLRSQEMKLPSNIGQKKLSNIGLVVTNRKIVSIGLEYPHAYDEIVKAYNEFRSNIVLLQDLKTALHNTEQELVLSANRLSASKNDNLIMTLPIEPRFRVSDTFYEELERNPVNVLNSPMTEGKGKGKSKLKVAPVTSREITKLIGINTTPSTVTRKRRAQHHAEESQNPNRK